MRGGGSTLKLNNLKYKALRYYASIRVWEFYLSNSLGFNFSSGLLEKIKKFFFLIFVKVWLYIFNDLTNSPKLKTNRYLNAKQFLKSRIPNCANFYVKNLCMQAAVKSPFVLFPAFCVCSMIKMDNMTNCYWYWHWKNTRFLLGRVHHSLTLRRTCI